MADDTISWGDFAKIDMRVGTVTRVEEFPEARKPAYKVYVDFGPTIGQLKTSAQITDNYTVKDLIGKQVVGIINFPTKQIGPFRSQFLLCGCYRKNDSVVIIQPEQSVPNGAKVS